jgi:chemotaxis protein MotB
MDTGTMQNVSQKGDGGMQNAGPATGASGGTSYRDPFAPDFWSQQIAEPAAEASAERAKIEGDPIKPGDKAAETQVAKVKAVPPSSGAPAQPGEATAANDMTMTAQDKTGKAEDAPSAGALKTAAEVSKQIAEAFKAGDKLHDGVSVQATDKGVIISITDQLDFGMFQIGSATPNHDLVLAMDKIGRIINGQKGKITIEGHTDARPFKSATYDNWRLSTARAQSAYYMLVRGGVEESRIVEVSGFADRKPKDASDPLAAVNRRIEIRLETDG